MIQDKMIEEIQELKLAGYTPAEVRAELGRRHKKAPTIKTVRKKMAFDCEPFSSAIVEIVEMNPGCYMSSVYDVLVEKFVEDGDYDELPGNDQTLRNYIHHLEEAGKIGQAGKERRKYDVIPTPPPGEKAQIDFGQERCEGGLTVHFMCILLWRSRLLGVYAQDHKFNAEGARRVPRVIGAAEGFTESAECWREFLSWLKGRGLRGVRMFTGDKAAGMVGALAEVFPDAAYQRCTVHFYRNALSKVPKTRRKLVAGMLKAIHAQESYEASEEKALRVADDLEGMRLKEAARVVREGYSETLAYTRFPMEHWKRIRTNNAIERLNREVRRRTRVVGTFPDGRSALMLVTARLKYVADSEWGSRRYLDVSLLEG